MAEQGLGAGGGVPFTDREIETLRLLAAKQAPPWWRNYPFLISVLAFLLSLATSITAAWSGHQKNINDQISQLSAAVQTIQDLNLRAIDIRARFGDTQEALNVVSLINSQLNNTLKLASDLALKLGTNASTAALLVVAQGLAATGDIGQASQLLSTGLAVARNANDESVALRNLGSLRLRFGRTAQEVAEGDEMFRQASLVERKYEALAPETALWLRAVAFGDWAIAAAPVNCEQARIHFAEEERLLEAPVHTPDLDQLRTAVSGQKANGIGGVAACRPG